jgi:hypothetical protein
VQIFQAVWGYDFGLRSHNLWVYMSYLRAKLEAVGEPRILHIGKRYGSAPATARDPENRNASAQTGYVPLRAARQGRRRYGGGTRRARNRSDRGGLAPLPDEAAQLLPSLQAALGVDVA